MAKPRRAAAREPAPDFDQVLTDPLELASSYLAQAGLESTEVRFYVYRRVEEGRKPDVLLFKCAPDDFDAEAIGKNYGTGTYRIRVYVKDEEHPNGVLRPGGGLFAVEMPAGYKPAAAAAVTAPSGEGSSFERLMLEMMRQQNERFERVLERIAQPREEPDPMRTLDGLKQLAEIVKPPPPAAAAAAAGPDFSATLAAAKQLLDLSQGLRGGAGEEGGDDPDSFLMRRGISVVEKMIEKALAERTRAPAPPAAQLEQLEQPIAAPASSPAAAAAPNEPEEEGVMMFKYQLRQACKAAAEGEDAAEYAEDAFPFIADGDLRMIANEPNWFSILVGAVPECAVHQVWFTAARDRLVAMAREEGVLTGSPAAATLSPPTNAGKSGDGTTAGGSGGA